MRPCDHRFDHALDNSGQLLSKIARAAIIVVMFDIDIVITWVDGADVSLAAKRDHYLGAAQEPLHDNGTNPHRWLCSDELNFCLRSINNHAPWVRRIWIVTDNQSPDVSGIQPEFTDKIEIVDHTDIFAGFEAALPTFNSLAIETLLWRIPGLAERFVYFNDDVFLTAAVKPSDFFTETGPVLRGKWADYSDLDNCAANLDDARLLNHFNQIKSAELAGYTADHIFASAHVAHPMQRSVMAQLLEKHSDRFARNSAYRFRSTDQFLPQSLYSHTCLKDGLGRIETTSDYLHIAVGALDRLSSDDVYGFLTGEERRSIKFLCINDLPEVEKRFPNVQDWIEEAIA